MVSTNPNPGKNYSGYLNHHRRLKARAQTGPVKQRFGLPFYNY
jgi:hypothetical protein